MSEIKVGDRGRVYGYAEADDHNIPWYDGELCTVEKVQKFNIIVKIFVLKLKFHRKQFYKLVKVRKCKECSGTGKNIRTIDFKCCIKCNGKGKVKV